MAGKRVAALDGVRGLAILLVMVAHFAGGVIPHNRPFFARLTWTGGGGGLVGVQLFFVLSGFLITSLLLGEWDVTGGVRLVAFYKRRFRRLMPALVVLCIVYLLLNTAIPQGRAGSSGAVFKALTYTANLPLSFSLTNNGWLSHTWSLAVEEQFYLVWPGLLLAVIAWRGKRAAIRLAATVFLCTIAVRHGLPLLMHGHAARVQFIEYNLLRWDALMAGCLLAMSDLRLPIPRVMTATSLALISLLVVWLPSPIPTWTYTASTLACAVILRQVQELSVFRARWLIHLGIVSYSLYLWHLFVLRYGLPGPLSLVLSFAAAEISYRFVEVPFRRRLFPESSQSLTASKRPTPTRTALTFPRH